MEDIDGEGDVIGVVRMMGEIVVRVCEVDG